MMIRFPSCSSRLSSSPIALPTAELTLVLMETPASDEDELPIAVVYTGAPTAIASSLLRQADLSFMR